MDSTRYFPFAGRLLIALTFVMSGLSKVADYSGTLGLISATKLPLPAPLAYAGAVAVEIVCSVMLIVGFRTRGRRCPCAVLRGHGGVLPRQFRRSEQHHPLLEERGDDRRIAPDRRLWCGCLEHRQPPLGQEQPGDARVDFEGVAGHDRRRN